MVFNEVFLSDGTAISMSLQVLFLWPLITISGLLAAISLSVCISVCISQSIVASLFSMTIAGLCSYHLYVRYLDVVVLTCFPMYICGCLVMSLNILSFCKFRTARHNVVVSSYLLHILPIGSVPSFIIQAWYDLVAKPWSCAAIIRPSVSAFSPVLLSPWLVLFWSTSAS